MSHELAVGVYTSLTNFPDLSVSNVLLFLVKGAVWCMDSMTFLISRRFFNTTCAGSKCVGGVNVYLPLAGGCLFDRVGMILLSRKE